MLVCGDSEQLAVSSSSVGFTAAKVLPTSGNFTARKCDKVIFQVFTDVAYVCLSGAAASATNGFELAVGDFMVLEGYDNIAKMRFIRKTTDAVVKAFFFYRS
jgi:hypothetical protein